MASASSSTLTFLVGLAVGVTITTTLFVVTSSTTTGSSTTTRGIRVQQLSSPNDHDGDSNKDNPDCQHAPHSNAQSPSSVVSQQPLMDAPELDLRLLRKAEGVIQKRTSRLVIVIERCTNDHNHSAILRTAEALGIQHVYIIDPPILTDGIGNIIMENGNDDPTSTPTSNTTPPVLLTNTGHVKLKLTAAEISERQKHRLFAQNATEWIDIHEYTTTTECLKDLKDQGFQIWATDLSQEAVCMTAKDLRGLNQLPLPNQLAIVFGTEAVGCSKEMLEAADLRVYLPLRGFADSLNLSVSTALVIHHLFLLDPSLVGDMSEVERRSLREKWFTKLALQRVLSSKDKKTRKKLQSNIDQCIDLQAKQDAAGTAQVLTASQRRRLSKLQEYQDALREFDERKQYDPVRARASVEDLVERPPQPLTDLRRADTHRVSFVGKNTKEKHREHWKDMHATANYGAPENSTCAFFRERLLQRDDNDTK